MLNVVPYVLLYLVPAVISAGLAWYAWGHRHIPSARSFSYLMLAIVFWSICHTFSVASSQLPSVLFWAQVQYGGIVLIGPFWLLFALRYTGASHQNLLWTQRGLLLIAAITYVMVLTNGLHHLWWPTVGLDLNRPFGSLEITRGPLFWAHAVFSYSCVLLGFTLILRAAVVTQPPFRRQAWLVTFGALFPIVGNIVHLLGWRMTVVDDPTPFLFAGSGLMMGYAVLRYQLLDLTPIAQREIFNHLPDGIVVLDMRGYVTAINTLAPPLLATNRKQWLGEPFLASLSGSPLETALYELLVPPALAANREFTYEHDGELRAIELHLIPLEADGVRAGSLLVLRDRTARMAIERSLGQQINNLTLLNHLARAANAAIQTDQVVRTIVRELIRNQKGERITLGLLRPGQSPLYLVVDEAVDLVPTLEGQVLSHSDFPRLPIVITNRNIQVVQLSDPTLIGTPTYALLQSAKLSTVLIVPLYGQSKPLGAMFVGYTAEHTIQPDERRFFEIVGELVADAILRSQLHDQAQEASRTKSAFLATVSHELRTPLTSIMGFTAMLSHDVFGGLPERAYEPLSHIEHNSKRLLRLIDDILDFSKLEAGRFHVDLYPVSISSVVSTVVNTLQPQVQERNLELRVDVPRDAPLVHANSERLEQVLMNLIANAIKFTDHGSILVRVTYDEERLRCSVSDTGIGIAPEHLHLLFQEFRQIDNHHTRSNSGTGLGLAISKRLMEVMGGSLTVESSLGAGSTFTCELQLATERLREQVAGSPYSEVS